MARILIRYNVHPLEKAGKWATVFAKRKFEKNPKIQFQRMAFKKTNVGILLARAAKIKERKKIMQAKKEMNKIMREYLKKAPKVITISPRKSRLVMEREKKINELFENPAVKKAVKIVGKSFENSYEIRKKLDEKAIKKGFIPIEIHAHSSPAIEIRYAKEFKNIAEKLCKEMKKKGHNVVILEDTEVKKTGKHISFELPGKKKKTNLSVLLEQKTPRFLVDKTPATTWTTYSFTPTEKTTKQGKLFLIDALNYLQKVKK